MSQQTKSVMVTTMNIEDVSDLTLEQMCELCAVTPDFIEAVMEYGVLEPVGEADNLRFTQADLRRIRTVLHLQNDLEVNVAGAALVVDLIEEIERLRTRMDVLESYFKRN